MRDSTKPNDPTPLLWIDFSKVVGSNTLRLDDFTNSTPIDEKVALDVVELARANSAKHPPQPLRDVCMKPHNNGQLSFIETLLRIRYVGFEDDGQVIDSTLSLLPVRPLSMNPWFNALDKAKDEACDSRFRAGELDAAQILAHDLNLKLLCCKSLESSLKS